MFARPCDHGLTVGRTYLVWPCGIDTWRTQGLACGRHSADLCQENSDLSIWARGWGRPCTHTGRRLGGRCVEGWFSSVRVGAAWENGDTRSPWGQCDLTSGWIKLWG